MIHFEKSQPAPKCLETEKAKANGDYKCGAVLERLSADFKNKCYICEYKEPETINVEHFIPHEGDKELKFGWNNLFWACGHCNNIKLAVYTNLLNCTVSTDNVDTDLKYIFKPLPFEHVNIEVLKDDDRVRITQKLLLAVYNGTTSLKVIESANLRNKLLEEVWKFQQNLVDYFKDTNSVEDKEYFLIRIRGHLSKASNFTAFKRWIIRENERLREEFEKYFD
jgi:hypothetical protein